MDKNIEEKILYLMNFIDDYMEKAVYEVLADSKEDPQYSAVTTANIIKCYIDVMKHFDAELPYSDIKEYFEDSLFTAEEYKAFENSRIKESEYYIGKIY